MTRLRYVDDSAPGFMRRRSGKRFAYFDIDGKRVKDKAEIERIDKLAIPPAYERVWICPHPNGHLQATGRDARGRKQYRYHADWRRARDEDKFERMVEFGRLLPRIRRRVASDLRGAKGRPDADARRDSVLAALVRLLDSTLVRIGNERYAEENHSFGLTTLRRRHAMVKGDRLQLHFKGKSGVPHEVDLTDPLVARVVRRCQALPGQQLFNYRDDDDGDLHPIESQDVNNYLQQISGAEISAKDFRTWHGSVLALSLVLQGEPPPTSTEVLREVAASLRNTVAVCRKSYVHPRILQACVEAKTLPPPTSGTQPRGLSAAESGLLHFLLGAAAGATRGKNAAVE